MLSQLTWNAFRKYIPGEPVFDSIICSSRLLSSRNQKLEYLVTRKYPYHSIHEYSQSVARKSTDSSAIPGLTQMMKLLKMIGARPTNELVSQLKKSWHEFFAYKVKNSEIVNGFQAKIAWQTYKYLKQLNLKQGSGTLNIKEMRLANRALRRSPDDEIEYHKCLAMELYSELQGKERSRYHIFQCLQYFLETLSSSGNTLEAWKLLENNIPLLKTKLYNGNNRFISCDLESFWLLILRGFALEKNEVELLRVFDVANENGIVFNSTVHSIMTTFFADKNDIENTKQWFNKPIIGTKNCNPYPMLKTLSSVLEFCWRNNQLEWCDSVFKQVLSTNPSKRTWDLSFRWASGPEGNMVGEVEKIIEMMIHHNPHKEALRPDVDSINELVKMAISKGDSGLSERYVCLGLKYGIMPNSRTSLLWYSTLFPKLTKRGSGVGSKGMKYIPHESL